MSPLSLYYTTADIVDDFIGDTMHLFGRVTVKSTVTKKSFGCWVFISVRTRGDGSMYYSTLVRVQNQANQDFLLSVISHLKSLCLELYTQMDATNDSN